MCIKLSVSMMQQRELKWRINWEIHYPSHVKCHDFNFILWCGENLGVWHLPPSPYRSMFSKERRWKPSHILVAKSDYRYITFKPRTYLLHWIPTKPFHRQNSQAHHLHHPIPPAPSSFYIYPQTPHHITNKHSPGGSVVTYWEFKSLRTGPLLNARRWMLSEESVRLVWLKCFCVYL